MSQNYHRPYASRDKAQNNPLRTQQDPRASQARRPEQADPTTLGAWQEDGFTQEYRSAPQHPGSQHPGQGEQSYNQQPYGESYLSQQYHAGRYPVSERFAENTQSHEPQTYANENPDYYPSYDQNNYGQEGYDQQASYTQDGSYQEGYSQQNEGYGQGNYDERGYANQGFKPDEYNQYEQPQHAGTYNYNGGRPEQETLEEPPQSEHRKSPPLQSSFGEGLRKWLVPFLLGSGVVVVLILVVLNFSAPSAPSTAQIREVQQYLIDIAYYQGSADGQSSTALEEAIQQFQVDFGYDSVDGLVTSDLIAMLQDVSLALR